MAAREAAGLAKYWTRFRAFHEKHPIIVGYMIVCGAATPYTIYDQVTKNPVLSQINKYRNDYIVIRPDDPQVHVLKTGRINLDY